ncbi:hypothetical protein PDESU_05837 [Pontiella desulfatans]|uniref:FRG domain-containing protein n=1 Tax=Pontiella desulfatans TaxID=2750659 RepID=A0A6C2UCT9_PONDE|nr:FRG domain-containing protein [Pontiella desulfatans]VGO17241.1 hypothetical protein PDESU_05837 [Pontiella desulfatans]
MNKPATKEISVHSLAEFVKHVCDVESDWNGNDWKICWFRGCGTNHSLLPSQYRPGYKNDVHDEESTFLEFKQQARGFLDRELNDWEMYFLMQHYGVPTRLLDWTSNCLVALFFALLTNEKDGDPCVWMLNPFLFNHHNAPIQEPYIMVPPNSVNERYSEKGQRQSLHWINHLHPLRFNQKQDSNGKDRNIERPIAISPPLLDRRVVAQSSFFTLHGGLERSIDENCMDCDESSHVNFIRKFVLSVDREVMLRQLTCFGITRQRVYPDLDGLGRELRHRLMDI